MGNNGQSHHINQLCTLVYTGSSQWVDSWHNGTKYDLRYLCLDQQISQTVYGGHDSKNMEWD